MYTYKELLDDINYLKFMGLETGTIGLSESGISIPYLFAGCKTGNQIIITGGIHARENITSLLIVRQAFNAMRCGIKKGGVYFIPMVNVDGVILIEHGAEAFTDRKSFLTEINGSDDFSLWKANINGVDLNTNFDAGFGKGLSNINYPASQNYTGPYPFSEAETRALRDFTYKIKPQMTISYHALGRELYWYFGQTENLIRDNDIASRINLLLDYRKVDDDMGSAGGYKDWCIKSLKIPAITLEIVSERFNHPLPDEAIDGEWEKHKSLPQEFLEIVNGYKIYESSLERST